MLYVVMYYSVCVYLLLSIGLELLSIDWLRRLMMTVLDVHCIICIRSHGHIVI